MGVGVMGTIRPSDVNVNDVDIFYTFASNRETPATNVQRLNPSDILTPLNLPTNEQVENEDNLLEGFFNLKLPATTFNELGFYTIYLRPSVSRATIVDCSVLSSLPSVKGIVLNINDLPENYRSNNALQGYKIEYINDNGTKLRNTVRYIVTSNRVVPISQNVGNTSQKSIRYRFDDSGSLLFLQLTPSSSSDLKPNALPFIGNPGQTILISNTFFNPMAIEINLVENTIDTVMNVIGGEQIKDVDNGILTYYDNDRNIIKQFDLYEIKDDVGDVSLYEVKEKRTNIDESQNFDEIIDQI